MFNLTISIALIFNQYVNPIALKNISWKYYVGVSCIFPSLYAVPYPVAALALSGC